MFSRYGISFLSWTRDSDSQYIVLVTSYDVSSVVFHTLRSKSPLCLSSHMPMLTMYLQLSR